MRAFSLDKLRGFCFRLFQIQKGPRDEDLPREPSMDDLMNLCCGPRFLSKALALHGKEPSAASGDKDPSARCEPRQ